MRDFEPGTNGWKRFPSEGGFTDATSLWSPVGEFGLQVSVELQRAFRSHRISINPIATVSGREIHDWAMDVASLLGGRVVLSSPEMLQWAKLWDTQAPEKAALSVAWGVPPSTSSILHASLIERGVPLPYQAVACAAAVVDPFDRDACDLDSVRMIESLM